MVKTQKRPLHYHVYNGTKEQLQEDQGTVNSFAQIFSFSIDMAAQVPLPASARHLNSNHSARTTFAY